MLLSSLASFVLAKFFVSLCISEMLASGSGMWALIRCSKDTPCAPVLLGLPCVRGLSDSLHPASFLQAI